jgi:hypothetical protein
MLASSLDQLRLDAGFSRAAALDDDAFFAAAFDDDAFRSGAR